MSFRRQNELKNIGLSLSVNQLRTNEQPKSFFLHSPNKSDRKPNFNLKSRFESDLERSTTTFSSHGSFYYFKSNMDFLSNKTVDSDTSRDSRLIHNIYQNQLEDSMENITPKSNNLEKINNENYYQFRMPSFTRFRKELEEANKNRKIKNPEIVKRRSFMFSNFI